LFIALLIGLLFYDYRLALLALLIYALLSMFRERRRIYESGHILMNLRTGILVSFDKSIKTLREKRPEIEKGFKAFPKFVLFSHLIELGMRLKSLSAKKMGRRKAIRAPSRELGFKIPRKRTMIPISWSATLRQLVKRGGRRITWDDIREKLYEGKGRLSLIVILDSSASMIYSIRQLHLALSAIRRKVLMHRDRISLISCKGFGAALVLHPTPSVNLFLQKLRMVGLSDYTPLASGMYLGYKLALRERRQGYVPLIVIISDGNVNVGLDIPLPENVKVHYYEKAVADALSVSKLIAKEKIPTVVINTRHRDDFSQGGIFTGTELMLSIAKITEGMYIAIKG